MATSIHNMNLSTSDSSPLSSRGIMELPYTENRPYDYWLGHVGPFIHNSVAGVLIVDKTGMMEYVNSGFCAIVGMTVDQLVGRPFKNILAPEREERLQRSLKKREKGLSEASVSCVIHRFGHRVWASYASNPIIDANTKETFAILTLVNELNDVALASLQEAILAGGSNGDTVADIDPTEWLQVGNLRIHRIARLIQFEGKLTEEITAVQHSILLCLAHRLTQPVPRNELIKMALSRTVDGSRSLDTHIRRLREVLKPFNGKIETVFGTGYCLKADAMTKAPSFATTSETF
jgi:PAS domain S-box-containing protein